MNRISRAFNNTERRAALIPFLTAGDPSFDISLSLFREVLASGADIVEIGIPYSDPLADGPVIQAASIRSLQAGFSLPRVFELTSTLRKETDKGLVLFTYVNPVIQYGFDAFFREAQLAGADGVIIPDLPFEESKHARECADGVGISLIPLIAPTSGQTRIAQICEMARGFVYCVSSLGVTGERSTISVKVQELVATVRHHTQLPVAVGFGVSTPQQANELAAYADGVIVGSAYIRRIEQALRDGATTDDLIQSVRHFSNQLVQAIR